MPSTPIPTRMLPTAAWLRLLGGGGTLSEMQFGFTVYPERKVMSQRVLPDHVVYFVSRNAAKVGFASQEVVLERGTLLWIMPGVVHETRLADDGSEFTNYYLRFRLSSGRSTEPRIGQDWLMKTDAWDLLPFLKCAIDALEEKHEFHESRIRGALLVVAQGLIQTSSEPAVPANHFSAQQRRKLARFVDLNSRKQIDVNMLAEVLDLSPAYFSRVFRRSFGTRPKNWIVQCRIQKAATLLMETELKAKEIAHQLGYSSRYYFSRQFRQIMGKAPNAFRRGK